MPHRLRIALGLLLGIVVGAIVNMGLIAVGGAVVPPPEGVDPNEFESIRAAIGDYAPIQFLPPFAAHAVGTLVGAMVAAAVVRSRSAWPQLAIGVWFLLGGITMVALIPETPVWFIALDLGVAYLPMAWLGGRLGGRLVRPRGTSASQS